MSTPVLLTLAVAYALAFWAVAAASPRFALLLIFAATPFQNDLSNGLGPLKFSLAEVNLLLALPVVLLRSRRWLFGPTLPAACIYLAVCLCSALGQWRPSTLQSILQAAIFTILLVVVFASLAKTEADYRWAFNGLIVVATFLACSVFALGSSYIYGLHKNGVGASLATTFVIALELWLASTNRKARFFYLSASAIIGLGCLFTVSRGAWLTAVTGSLVILAMRGRVGLVFKCAVVLIPLIALAWRFMPENSREYATGFGEERSNIKARYESIDYAWNLFEANPVLGAGMGLRKDYDATNVVILCLAETGVLGLITFLGLHGTVLGLVLGSYRRIPPETLSSSILAIALAMIVGKFMHGLVDHYWSRGSLTAAWAGVGMATRVISDHRRQRRQLAQVLAQQAYDETLLEAQPPAEFETLAANVAPLR